LRARRRRPDDERRSERNASRVVEPNRQEWGPLLTFMVRRGSPVRESMLDGSLAAWLSHLKVAAEAKA